MSKIVTLLFLCFLMSGFAFAQPLKKEIEKAKQIKLLESTREDVRKILAEFEQDEEDSFIQDFSTKNVEIVVIFSLDDCSDIRSLWKVPEGIATRVFITPEEGYTLTVKDFDFSNFKKDIPDQDSPDFFYYHDENSGISFAFDNDKVEQIILYPPKHKIAFLCETEQTEDFISGEKNFADLMVESVPCVLVNHHANVTELELSADEIQIVHDKEKKKQPNQNARVFITTTAVDPENDTLVYSYEISAGKIVGTGAKVVWDLSGVKAGTYTITAGVDDGCGVCGATVTKTVTIVECSDCSPK